MGVKTYKRKNKIKNYINYITVDFTVHEVS